MNYEPIEVDLLKLMDFIEEGYRSPALRWSKLRELIEAQSKYSKKREPIAQFEENGEMVQVFEGNEAHVVGGSE